MVELPCVSLLLDHSGYQCCENSETKSLASQEPIPGFSGANPRLPRIISLASQKKNTTQKKNVILKF